MLAVNERANTQALLKIYELVIVTSSWVLFKFKITILNLLCHFIKGFIETILSQIWIINFFIIISKNWVFEVQGISVIDDLKDIVIDFLLNSEWRVLNCILVVILVV